MRRRPPPPSAALPDWVTRPHAEHWLDDFELGLELARVIAWRRLRHAMQQLREDSRACPPVRPALPGGGRVRLDRAAAAAPPGLVGSGGGPVPRHEAEAVRRRKPDGEKLPGWWERPSTRHWLNEAETADPAAMVTAWLLLHHAVSLTYGSNPPDPPESSYWEVSRPGDAPGGHLVNAARARYDSQRYIDKIGPRQ